MLAAIEIEPADERSVRALDSLLVAEFLEQQVDVRKVVGGHVLYEDAHDFFVADAAIDPTQEKDQMHKRSQGNSPPIGFDEFTHDVSTCELGFAEQTAERCANALAEERGDAGADAEEAAESTCG